MQTSLYVGLSGQMALQKRMDTIAHNIANVQTTGFRGETINFQAVLKQAGDDSVAFADSGKTFISRESGGLSKTGNPLDVAVSGPGWLSYSTPNGPVFSRDGRMSIDNGGILRSVNGYPVLDAGKSPITVDPKNGALSIASDCMISQGGKQVGAIGLFSLPASAKLTRFDNSSVVSDKPAEPVLDFVSNSINQGYLEGSNVEPASQMIQLIAVTRAFDAVTNATETTEGTTKDAIKTLG